VSDQPRKSHHGAKLMNVGLLALLCVVLLWLGISELRRGSYVTGGIVIVLSVAAAAATFKLFARYWRT
jgi:hypothetical protein